MPQFFPTNARFGSSSPSCSLVQYVWFTPKRKWERAVHDEEKVPLRRWTPEAMAAEERTRPLAWFSRPGRG